VHWNNGSGALNIDGGRIATEEDRARPPRTPNEIYGGGKGCSTTASESNSIGRYPANLILSEDTAPLLDEQSGDKIGAHGGKGNFKQHAWMAKDTPQDIEKSTGGASRFFYTAKSSTAERHAGTGYEGSQFKHLDTLRKVENKLDGKGNVHPTVKPIDLTRYLATLLLPPSSVKRRRLLVPFSGSGSEMAGGILAGWDEVVGVEQSAEYCAIAEQRLRFWSAQSGANTAEILKAATKNNVTPIPVAQPTPEVNQCNS
jgi:hypothetical protein